MKYMQQDLILRLRTKDNLLDLLQAGKSGAWKVAKEKEDRIKTVQIFNWDGTLVLEASHDEVNSFRTENQRLVVALNSADARITKHEPTLQWSSQNPVSYLDVSGSEEHGRDSLEEPLPFGPDAPEEIHQSIADAFSATYGEPVRLVAWNMTEDGTEITGLFRERRRGWYFDVKLSQHDGTWSANYRVLPLFKPLLEADETIWADLTSTATSEDWLALDEIFFTAQLFPDTQVLLAGSDLIGEEAAEEAMEKFGFYVPDQDMLPAFLVNNSRLRIMLMSYFKHTEGFAKENLLTDHNTKSCEVINSLAQAENRLYQKLYYYAEEA